MIAPCPKCGLSIKIDELHVCSGRRNEVQDWAVNFVYDGSQGKDYVTIVGEKCDMRVNVADLYRLHGIMVAVESTLKAREN